MDVEPGTIVLAQNVKQGQEIEAVGRVTAVSDSQLFLETRHGGRDEPARLVWVADVRNVWRLS